MGSIERASDLADMTSRLFQARAALTDEQLKMLQTLQQNAAATAQQVNQLSKQVTQLATHNDQLKTESMQLQAENAQLRQQLEEVRTLMSSLALSQC